MVRGCTKRRRDGHPLSKSEWLQHHLHVISHSQTTAVLCQPSALSVCVWRRERELVQHYWKCNILYHIISTENGTVKWEKTAERFRKHKLEESFIKKRFKPQHNDEGNVAEHSIHLSICPSIHLSIYLSSIHPSIHCYIVHLSFYLSFCLFYLSVCLSISDVGVLFLLICLYTYALILL